MNSNAFKAIVSKVTATVTKLIGVEQLESLKIRVDTQYRVLSDAKQTFKNNRESYYSVVEQRRESQQEVNNLLNQKPWSSSGVLAYTEQIQKEHQLGLLEQKAKQDMMASEKALEELQAEFEYLLRARYQEEIFVSERNSKYTNLEQYV